MASHFEKILAMPEAVIERVVFVWSILAVIMLIFIAYASLRKKPKKKKRWEKGGRGLKKLDS